MVVSITFFSLHPSHRCCAVFSTLASYVTTAYHGQAQLWPVAGLFWSQLELSLSKTGTAADLFSQKPLLQTLQTLNEHKVIDNL